MSENMFNTANLDDLPQELKNELKKKNLNSGDEKILSLFSEKNELSIDEILIALYRKYKIVQKRTWVSNRLFVLSKAGQVGKIKKGRYKINKNVWFCLQIIKKEYIVLDVGIVKGSKTEIFEPFLFNKKRNFEVVASYDKKQRSVW